MPLFESSCDAWVSVRGSALPSRGGSQASNRRRVLNRRQVILSRNDNLIPKRLFFPKSMISFSIRETICSRNPRITRTSAAKAKSPATVLPALPGRSLQLCGGQQLDLGGGASYPALRCKLCVIGVNYAWNFTFLLLPAQSGASIGETGTHSRGSCTWQSPRQ